MEVGWAFQPQKSTWPHSEGRYLRPWRNRVLHCHTGCRLFASQIAVLAVPAGIADFGTPEGVHCSEEGDPVVEADAAEGRAPSKAAERSAASEEGVHREDSGAGQIAPEAFHPRAEEGDRLVDKLVSPRWPVWPDCVHLAAGLAPRDKSRDELLLH